MSDSPNKSENCSLFNLLGKNLPRVLGDLIKLYHTEIEASYLSICNFYIFYLVARNNNVWRITNKNKLLLTSQNAAYADPVAPDDRDRVHFFLLH
jgi:hypothetical protein